MRFWYLFCDLFVSGTNQLTLRDSSRVIEGLEHNARFTRLSTLMQSLVHALCTQISFSVPLGVNHCLGLPLLPPLIANHRQYVPLRLTDLML